MKSDFVVYAYAAEDGTFYYIGKGKPNRPYKKNGRGCPRPKDRSKILVLHRGLDENTALEYEKKLIEFYGRKDKQLGPLLNKSDGNTLGIRGKSKSPVRDDITYEEIVNLSQASSRPDDINPQTWDRIKRVARSPRLAAIDPEYLPESLSALTELLRLPERRFRMLEEAGLLGKGMAARAIREIGLSDGPVQVLVRALVWPDGRVEIGEALPHSIEGRTGG